MPMTIETDFRGIIVPVVAKLTPICSAGTSWNSANGFDNLQARVIGSATECGVLTVEM